MTLYSHFSKKKKKADISFYINMYLAQNVHILLKHESQNKIDIVLFHYYA